MSTDDKIAHAVGILVVTLLVAAMVIVMMVRAAYVLHRRIDVLENRVQWLESVRTNATPERTR